MILILKSGSGLYSWYKGTAKLNASARLKKDVKVDNVRINGRVITDGLCWASKIFEFTLELDKDGKAEYSKLISTGEAGMLKPDEPKIYYNTFVEQNEKRENEFCIKNALLQVSGNVIE